MRPVRDWPRWKYGQETGVGKSIYPKMSSVKTVHNKSRTKFSPLPSVCIRVPAGSQFLRLRSRQRGHAAQADQEQLRRNRCPKAALRRASLLPVRHPPRRRLESVGRKADFRYKLFVNALIRYRDHIVKLLADGVHYHPSHCYANFAGMPEKWIDRQTSPIR